MRNQSTDMSLCHGKGHESQRGFSEGAVALLLPLHEGVKKRRRRTGGTNKGGDIIQISMSP